MKAKFGAFLMVLGLVLVVSALSLFLSNEREQSQAADAVDELMPQIVDVIQERQEPSVENPTTATEEVLASIVPQPQNKEMPVVEIDGYDYIGFVGIPALGLELPVMSDWSYPQLRKSPCRYTGDLYNDDLVIMAHNYVRHFGNLQDLRVDDTVTFTDMDGQTTEYRVVALDILDPTAIEEMTAGHYDLTLFTCTYGGQSRVTVRCDRVEN